MNRQKRRATVRKFRSHACQVCGRHPTTVFRERPDGGAISAICWVCFLLAGDDQMGRGSD